MQLFFPSVHDEHWFLFVVDMVARKFIFLDSVYEEDSTFHMEIRDLMVIRPFLNLLFIIWWCILATNHFFVFLFFFQIQNFIKVWKESNLRRMGFRNYGIAYPNIPKQTGR